jgi:RNA polymerase subunit RPABC4/transcription elongation factor Spt4
MVETTAEDTRMTTAEKLTACKRCQYVVPSDDGPSSHCCRAQGKIPVFDSWNGHTITYPIIPMAIRVNSDGHCPHFEEKE